GTFAENAPDPCRPTPSSEGSPTRMNDICATCPIGIIRSVPPRNDAYSVGGKPRLLILARQLVAAIGIVRARLLVRVAMKGEKGSAKREGKRSARLRGKKRRQNEAATAEGQRQYQKELTALARPTVQKAIASIRASPDEKWLRGFRNSMIPAGESEIVRAIDVRLAELEELRFRRRISAPVGNLSLEARVRESVRVFLFR